MAGALLAYATRDGQTRRIAQRVAARLKTQPIDLKTDSPGDAEIATAQVVVVIAAVRYGRHLPEAELFLARYARLRAKPRLALASVNLTARKEGKRDAIGNAYLRKLIARHALAPALAAAFAGRLDYPRYTWRDRQIIRLIMWLTGGPTDPSAQIDYTDWSAVDAFAEDAARLTGSRLASLTPPDAVR